MTFDPFHDCLYSDTMKGLTKSISEEVIESRDLPLVTENVEDLRNFNGILSGMVADLTKVLMKEYNLPESEEMGIWNRAENAIYGVHEFAHQLKHYPADKTPFTKS